jgi:glyoxylase-like metal-dependent hydrolase (beta-lactamase superfamily II)
MKLHTIDTGYFKLDGGAMFGVVPKSIWHKLNPADENNMCTWAMRCLLIETGDRLVLVDTGIGRKQDARFFSHYYLHGKDTLESSLAAKGFSAKDITDVLLTHLHFDHVGGAVQRVNDRLEPAFPHAVYWSNATHWQAAVQPNAREKASFLKENILPIRESGQLKFIDSPGATAAGSNPAIQEVQAFMPDVTIRFASGHTEAMMLPVIRYKGRTVVYMADLLPSVAHVPLPYIMSYDMQPLLTLHERETFWQEAVDQEYVLVLEHDPLHECCTLQQTEKGIRVKETFRLDAL